MPNTHQNITDLFDDIADAIREKDETTDPIVADTFPARIRAIPSGGGTVADKLIYFNDFDTQYKLDSDYTANILPAGLSFATESISVPSVNSSKCAVLEYGTASPSSATNISFQTTTMPKALTIGGWFYLNTSNAYATPFSVQLSGSQWMRPYYYNGWHGDKPSGWGEIIDGFTTSSGWHHLAMTVEIRDQNPCATFYINGQVRNCLYASSGTGLDVVNILLSRGVYCLSKMTSIFFANSCLSGTEIYELMTSNNIIQ